MRRIIAAVVAALALGAPLPAAHASDGRVWEQLRSEDGVVVLFRHALAPGTGDPPEFQLGDCSTQRNLSAVGRAQARAMGARFRQEGVPVTALRSSRWCRALDTARLMNLGPVLPTPALDSVFTAPEARAERQRVFTERIIRAHRGAEGVAVLVGHQVNITQLTGIAPAPGEGVVVRANAQGRIEVLGTIPAP
jgi:phosphohistidine phosphatase SixA